MNFLKFFYQIMTRTKNYGRFNELSCFFKLTKKIDENEKYSYTFIFKINKLILLMCYFIIS